MMESALSLTDVERIVAERAHQLGHDLSPDRIHVYEDADASDGRVLIVEIAARRPQDRSGWAQQRLRFTQTIRDGLLAHGDDRYPVLTVFSPEEWPSRND